MAETTRVRRFWCRAMDRDVEVVLTEPGPFASGRPAVGRCSAFEVGEEITCPRFCIDPSYRRPCRPALVVTPLPGQRWW